MGEGGEDIMLPLVMESHLVGRPEEEEGSRATARWQDEGQGLVTDLLPDELNKMMDKLLQHWC